MLRDGRHELDILRTAPGRASYRCGWKGAERANSATHRGAFRADDTRTTKSERASYQTYRHARASTITTRTIIKLISAHKLSVRLLPLLSLCIVMTSLQDASPTVNWLEGAHDQQEALIQIKNRRRAS